MYSKRAVATLAVMVSFDVLKYGFTHLGTRAEALTVDALIWEKIFAQAL